jgi:hypothetical protein
MSLIEITDKLIELIDDAARKNTGADNHPIDRKLLNQLEECADFVHSLIP